MRVITGSLLAILFCLAPLSGALARAPERASQVSVVQPLVPNFSCADQSYTNMVKHGITLGISPDYPYTYLSANGKQAQGIDVAINRAALKWIGVKKVRYQIMPFASLIPALQANKIDVIADNIHETPARVKVISFTSPSWWYGPALIVRKGNPGHIHSYHDLSRSGVTVGTVAGSAAAEYLNHIGAKAVNFTEDTSEFAAAAQGRVTVTLEDITKFAAFKKKNPHTNLVVLNIPTPRILISVYGYSYARYGLRKGDCTLNFAYTRALAEMRANGQIGAILKRFGLPKKYVFLPGVS